MHTGYCTTNPRQHTCTLGFLAATPLLFLSAALLSFLLWWSTMEVILEGRRGGT